MDALSPADGNHDDPADGRRAELDGLGDGGRPPTPVAGPADLDTGGAPANRVAALDGSGGDRASTRVAGFDELGSADRPSTRVADFDGSGGDRPATRVAGLDGSGGDRPSARVAGFFGLDGVPAPPASVAPLDALDGPRRTAPTRRPATGPGSRLPASDGPRPDAAFRRARRSGAPAATDLDGPGRSTASRSTAGLDGPGASDTAASGADDIPPDRPLPRGRRRGARAGRLGPDAPDPDATGPEADPVVVAREICLRLLTDRARTRQELAQALARKGVPDDAAAAVLDRFGEVGLIDDVAFAGQWVRSRHAHRGLGRRAIAVELRRKGVADDVAGEALAEVDAESEDRRARELVDRKLRSITVDTAEQRVAAARRLVGMLARKGYGAGTAYRVVKEALAERGAEIDGLGAEPAD